jgi:hypothetical protein
MELEISECSATGWYETTQANRSAGPRRTCGDLRTFSDVQIRLRHFRDAWRSRYFLAPISYT